MFDKLKVLQFIQSSGEIKRNFFLLGSFDIFNMEHLHVISMLYEEDIYL